MEYDSIYAGKEMITNVRCIAGLRGHRTRTIKCIRTTIQHLTAHPSPESAKEVRKQMPTLEMYQDKLAAGFL